MRNLFRKIRSWRFDYRPLVHVVVYKKNLLYNYKLFKKNIGQNDLWPVLKSNAYGHGLVEVAKIFDTEQCGYLIVDSYYEAMILRNEGIKTPILIIGFTFDENIIKNKLRDITFVVGDLEQIDYLSTWVKTQMKVHIKVDTGMNRQGLELEDFESAWKSLSKNKLIIVEGVCSHLADADSLKKEMTLRQIGKWNQLVDRYSGEKEIKYWHLGASSSLFFVGKIRSNAVRLGLGLYGYNIDSKIKLNLKPALEMYSVISSIRKVKKGEKIGYNFTFVAKEDMWVATVPVGYFEGVDRRLSDIGFVKVGDVFCRIVGRVSMNIISIDVSKIEDRQVGQEVQVIGKLFDEKNSVESMARLAETIPYEILVHVERKIKRIARD
ncbi:MAG: alanine racemase [Patescibacteria group bacterium]